MGGRPTLNSTNSGCRQTARGELRKPREPDTAGELVRTVQQVERGEVVDPADVIAPALAAAKQDAGGAAGRGLAHLHVETVGMHGRFTGDGDAALVPAKVIFVRSEPERRGELEETAVGVTVEQALGVGIVGNAVAEIEPGRSEGVG